MIDRRQCNDCAAALVLLNKHLHGRVYTSLDDALRNLLQAFVTLRDNRADSELKIYERLWSRLEKFAPKDSDARAEFDWVLTKISRELSSE